MKAINGGANHRSSLCLDQRGHFVSQHGFACCVNPINGNPQRMGMGTRDQKVCQLMEGLLSCRHCSSLPLKTSCLAKLVLVRSISICPLFCELLMISSIFSRLTGRSTT